MIITGFAERGPEVKGTLGECGESCSGVAESGEMDRIITDLKLVCLKIT